MRAVAKSATTINTMAPTRSDQTARLKKTHHNRTVNPPITQASTPIIALPGITMGTTNPTSHCSATASRPGHNRIGFRDVNSSVCVIVMSDHTALPVFLFRLSWRGTPRQSFFLEAGSGNPLFVTVVFVWEEFARHRDLHAIT